MCIAPLNGPYYSMGGLLNVYWYNCCYYYYYYLTVKTVSQNCEQKILWMRIQMILGLIKLLIVSYDFHLSVWHKRTDWLIMVMVIFQVFIIWFGPKCPICQRSCRAQLAGIDSKLVSPHLPRPQCRICFFWTEMYIKWPEVPFVVQYFIDYSWVLWTFACFK